MAIDSLEAIPSGGTKQWIRVRGADAANPVLLLIKQGPGLPARTAQGWISRVRELASCPRLRPLRDGDAAGFDAGPSIAKGGRGLYICGCACQLRAGSVVGAGLVVTGLPD